MTGKDLDYIKDIFNYNIVAIKKYQEYQNYLQDDNIIKMLNKLIKEHTDNAKELEMLLEEYQNE